MDDVFTTAEAVGRFGRSAVRHRVRSGRWQQPHRGVVVTHSGPLSRDERERALLAACPPGSALAGLTALARDGFEGFSPARPQLVLPDGARRPALDAEVHWSTYLDPRDVHPLREPRRTRTARSIVDAAAWSEHRRLARAVVIAGVQQRLTSTAHLREALGRRGACRHRAVIVESVLDAHGGVQSLPERDFEEVRVAAGLPRPVRQARVRTDGGRYHLDVLIPEVDLAVEIHGIPHLAVARWDADLMRANEIVIAGERLLIFSSYAIRHERSAVVDQLRRAAARVSR